ncbi:MAG: hypothetical protein VX726_00100 [Planctomycetota bacterium]|nr:hypothetical protein [Planctomycetota bacterium]MEE2894118.1 hypothetical protein [Planctomycetota bacterium]
MESTGGLLRLAPNWVPRSFLQPGLRLKLHPDDTYAYGLGRGGIDERWFGSTTEAANEGRGHDEGLSYVVHEGSRFLLRDVVAELGASIVGEEIWSTYGRWPVYSKFFDNMGPIPHHMHQDDEQAALVGLEGKPEAYYFPPQHNHVGNNFPHTFMGFEPGTTREQVRRCIADWHKGDNRILELSKAYKLQVGTGWLIPPCVLHAPGSFCTYEPQWGSDVFGMYQNLVEGREVPRSLLVKDMPPDRHDDVEFILDQLDWDRNLDPNFKDRHYIEPIVDTRDDAHADRWIVYGTVDGRQRFSAKELTVRPGCSTTIVDRGASSITVVQGSGRLNGLVLDCPKLIRFHELTRDEVFVTDPAARAGLTFENTSDTEDLVVLRYFGPEVNPHAPEVGDHRRG